MDATPTETAEMPDPAFLVTGRGPTERSIDVPEDYVPFILGAGYPKGAVLIVRLRGEGFRRTEVSEDPFFFDAPESSVTATPGIASGTYELTVKGTKGSWTLQFQEPDPNTVPPVPLFGQVMRGHGNNVVPVRILEETEVRWEMQTEGSFFSAELLGFAGAEGTYQFLGMLHGGLAFEPGDRGFRSDSVLPTGDYLLIVDADGRWAVRFRPID